MSPKHLLVRLIVAGAIGVGANGCDPSLRGPDLAAPSTRTGGRVALVVTDTVAPVGTRIAVSVTVDDARVGGLIGSLHFDPATLRFVGQPDPERPFTIVNDGAARRGVVRGLPRWMWAAWLALGRWCSRSWRPVTRPD
ncbi:MAG: hypothetical protein JNJ80_12155 [Gemmatimonadetes bacterium]|nr:hypothetical protein [Gemmatimonadota bacterium]